MSEPSLAEWFEIMSINRTKAKEKIIGYDLVMELYMEIEQDADSQLRRLSNRYSKLAYYADEMRKAQAKAQED